MDQNLRSILTGQTCSHIIHDTSVGTPPRLYNQIARVIAVNKGNSVHENARLFALINMAMADAAISTWDSKWFYDYWRPILGIRNADIDGNLLWLMFTWESNPVEPFPVENFSPPFPAYTSGHAA